MTVDTPNGQRAPGRAIWVPHLTLTLVLLFGLTFGALRAGEAGSGLGELTLLTGFVLLAASVAGGLAVGSGLPKLTGFLVVGIVAGPSLLGLLSEGVVAELRLIDEFALALIAMLAGGELKVQVLRPHARSIAVTTLTVTAIVAVGFAAVFVALGPFLPLPADLSFEGLVGVGLLLGVWAANSSPDLTVAVMEETRQKGALSEVILGITIVKDVVVIVLFTLTLSLIAPLIDAGSSFDSAALLTLAREVGGAIVVGAALGGVFSKYLEAGDGRPKPPLATFIFAYLLVVIAHRLHIELLLTGVAAGFVIENLSSAGDRMIRGIEAVSVVIFAFFFAIAGAGLDLAAVVALWPVALVLFAARALLTMAGAKIGAKWAGASQVIRQRTWQGLISQGGVTLGLLILIDERFPVLGEGVVALGTAVIIGNILGGPILLKRALLAAASEGDR